MMDEHTSELEDQTRRAPRATTAGGASGCEPAGPDASRSTYVAGVMVLVLGLVWCAFAAWMLLLTRRRPGTLPISAVLVAGMACLYPTVAGLWY